MLIVRGVYPEELKMSKQKSNTWMFVEALFVVAET